MAMSRIANTFNVGGSWIEAMEQEMVKFGDVELGIVFPYKSKEARHFTVDDHPVNYYMVPKYPIGKWGRFFKRVTSQTEPRQALKDFEDAINAFQPDLIMYFGTESTYGLLTSSVSIPSLVWFQGNLTVYHKKWYTEMPWLRTFLNERPFDILNGQSDLHKYLLYGKKVKEEQILFENAQNFIGRTDWDRRLVSIMAPQAKYFHCEEPMRETFMQEKWKPNPGRNKIVLVSTIRESPYKGLETVYQSCRLLESVVQRPVEWRIVGVHPDSSYGRMARKVSNVSSSESPVKLLGFKSGEELTNELKRADIYVHPSHIDNSPNSVCEAMVMGLPIVSTNVGGIPSLLIDRHEGLLVQNGDPYAMAGAILEFIEDFDLAIKMGENARRRGLKRHDAGVICSHLLGIYRKILHKD